MGNRVERIYTGTFEGIEHGYVAVDGEAQYDYELDTETGKQRTCGYGAGCFWTDWQ